MTFLQLQAIQTCISKINKKQSSEDFEGKQNSKYIAFIK